jgi:hypothetical protein
MHGNCNDESKMYTFEFDTRYRPGTAARPSLTKITLQDGKLHYQAIEIPRTGKGTRIVRLRGTYFGRDGDAFQRIEDAYAEISIVHGGFQFTIWWGSQQDLAGQSGWLAEFLGHDPLSTFHIMPRLEQHLTFVRGLKHRVPGQEEALNDLIRKLRSSVRTELLPGN